MQAGSKDSSKEPKKHLSISSDLIRKKCKSLGKANLPEEQPLPANTIGYGNAENIEEMIGGEVE